MGAEAPSVRVLVELVTTEYVVPVVLLNKLMPAAVTAEFKVRVPAVPPKTAVAALEKAWNVPVSDPLRHVVVDVTFQFPVPPVPAVAPFESQNKLV